MVVCGGGALHNAVEIQLEGQLGAQAGRVLRGLVRIGDVELCNVLDPLQDAARFQPRAVAVTVTIRLKTNRTQIHQSWFRPALVRACAGPGMQTAASTHAKCSHALGQSGATIDTQQPH